MVAMRCTWLAFVTGMIPGITGFVQPSAGLLVLFPSYLWHGTNAIQGSQVRTTIAFDAVPNQVA